MAEDELHGVNAAKVFGVHDVLAPRPVSAFGAQVMAHRRDDRIEEPDARHFEALTRLFQGRHVGVVDQGVKHQSRGRLDGRDNPRHLPGRPHHEPDVLLDIGIGELNETGSGDGADGLSGRVGNQVDMKSPRNQKTFPQGRTNWG